MTAITGELSNPIIFKKYILNLLEEDTDFKQQLLTALLKKNLPKKAHPLKKYSKLDKQNDLKKYSIRLETIEAL
ncbi:MAG: hypothetical protein RL329_1139 [Bacteroidota bacterium]|jgi:hypothetical protein